MKEQQIAAIYCRLSKEDLDKENRGNDSESIQNQKLLLMDYAGENGFLVYKVYVDEDLSGFSDRPGFKQMIKDAAGGHFNTILCKHQSRFTRDMELVERYIHGYFVEWGIRFISLTDNVDTNVKGNKKARQIYGLINEWYSEDLSENIRAVFRKKMEAGQFLGPFACYGYTKNPEDKHKLIIDDEAAQVVREIFSLYLEGYGASKIAIILTQRNCLPPSQYKKSKGMNFATPNSTLFSEKYGAWSATTIKKILRNETYIGTLIQGQERKVSYKSKKVVAVPQNEWVVVKNTHLPIIEETVFYKVRSLIERNRRGCSDSNIRMTEKSKTHILAGKLVCVDCGSTIERSGLSRDKKTYYLRCALSAKTKKRDCSPHFIRQDKLEAAILERLCALMCSAIEGIGDQAVLGQVLDELRETRDERPKIDRQMQETASKIREIQRSIASTYADKVKGLISESDFINFRSVFDEEMQSYIKKKQRLEKELVAMEMRQNSYDNLGALLEKYKTFDSLTHEIVNDFIDTILVGEKEIDTGEIQIVINWLF